MKKNNQMVIAAAITIIIILVGSFLFLTHPEKENIVGMYHISEYDQYGMDDGEFTYNHTGDGSYDTEFIEITSCENGIFEGYCCIPAEGEAEPAHYPILGSYFSSTGIIEYVCSYDYPKSGLYDWVHGSIKNGVMQLSGITFGSSEYYGSFEFTFIREGCEKGSVSFEPIFEKGDKYSSFKLLKSSNDTESVCEGIISLEVVSAGKGLYQFKLTDSDKTVDVVGATITDDIIMATGYWNDAPFSLVIADEGDYIQVNREYSDDMDSITLTAFLTEDGKAVTVKESPVPDEKTIREKFATKTTGEKCITGKVNVTVTTVSGTLIKIETEDAPTAYGNMIPYCNGTIIAQSSSDGMTSYDIGFTFVDEDLDTVHYCMLCISADGTLSVMILGL